MLAGAHNPQPDVWVVKVQRIEVTECRFPSPSTGSISAVLL